MALTLRLIKGSELTYAELDNNFAGLADGSNWAETVVPAGGVASPFIPFIEGDTTPSVLGGNHFETSNPGPTVVEITQFDDGADGQTIVVALTIYDKIINNANIITLSGADITGAANVLTAFIKHGSVWKQAGGAGAPGGSGTVWSPEVWA